MFVVLVGSVLTTVLFVQALLGQGEAPAGFILAVSLWLWFTVLFANFAEAMAEGRGKAQAETLRKRARRDITAKKLVAVPEAATSTRRRRATPTRRAPSCARATWCWSRPATSSPATARSIEGIASVDESAITGESAPVIRESGGDRSAVTGGTRVLSDWLVVRITANPGETFLDRMIAMVEGAKRQKTPNEIALNILLAGLTIIFLLATRHACCRSRIYSVHAAGQGTPVTVTVLVALLVCLIPTTIGGLLSAIGIAGMDRMIQANVIAMSGRAVEAAGDVDVLLLDKTGTITLGNRQATAFLPADGVAVSAAGRRRAARLAGRRDARRPQHRRAGEGEVRPARARRPRAGRPLRARSRAQTRMSGVNLDGRQIRKGAADAIEAYVREQGGQFPAAVRQRVETIATRGRHAAGRRRRRAGARRDPAEGHRQGRHQGALRRAAPHGHQDGDDHRRQSADRRRHRRRGRRGRLPGPGHARGQAEADPRVPDRRASWWP